MIRYATLGKFNVCYNKDIKKYFVSKDNELITGGFEFARDAIEMGNKLFDV